MLAELRQTLFVDYHGKQEARLVFPEFFEESVENTPARIIMREMHGCGHRYRYCFDLEHEPVIDALEEEVTKYLTQMSETQMSRELSARLLTVLPVIELVEEEIIKTRIRKVIIPYFSYL